MVFIILAIIITIVLGIGILFLNAQTNGDVYVKRERYVRSETDYGKDKQKAEKEAEEKYPANELSMAWALLGLIAIIPSFVTMVGTGEIGVKTIFGKVVGEPLTEGLSLKSPFENVAKMDIKVRIYENQKTLEASSKDLQIISNVKVAVNYQLETEKACEVYKTIGENYQNVIIEPAIENLIKAEISKHTAEELATARADITEAMVLQLNEKLNEYGISVLAVSLKNFDYSAEYNKAIEAKAVSAQEVLTAQERLNKAKIEAETKKVEAEAEAKANEMLERTLSKELIEKMYIEKWDGVLPKVSDGKTIINFQDL